MNAPGWNFLCNAVIAESMRARSCHKITTGKYTGKHVFLEQILEREVSFYLSFEANNKRSISGFAVTT